VDLSEPTDHPTATHEPEAAPARLAPELPDEKVTSAPAAELLHQIFERQAAADPSAHALICGSEKVTYGELEGRANQLAHFLQRSGVQRGDCVGLLLQRSIEVYVALLAILKAGAAYVPIDPDYPGERISFILSDCGARAVVTTGALAANVGGYGGEVISIDRSGPQITKESSAPLEPLAMSQDLCYVIYTSGSTGRPKGVQIEHRSACHLVRTENQIFQVQPRDKVYQGFSIAFDASVEEIWLAFSAGATLIVGTQEMTRAGPDLSRLLSQSGVTVFSTVPTMLAMMHEDVPSVRLLILGGEACPPDLVKRWWKPGRKFFNTYGPTEATVVATCCECHPDQPLTIGKPLPGYSAYVLDDRLQPVEPGVAGELCLGGVGLARGYVGRPDLTSEKFTTLSLPNISRPQRVYRTGDLVRMTADGEIEFLGRIDSQVKIRGFRVELSEIESVLMECPVVNAAAVTVREDSPGVQQLVGYVVLKPGVRSQESGVSIEQEIRARLKMRLPAYMVPGLLEVLSKLPTLASGKVDRRRLPRPLDRPSAQPVHAPQTEMEERIAEIWQKLFGPMAVGVQDDFFLDLGGHSLLAARMVSELRKTLGLEHVSVLDVYKHPTVEALAAELGQRLRATELQSIPIMGRTPSDTEGPRHSTLDTRHFLCGTAQLFSLIFVLSFFALQWLAPYLTYTLVMDSLMQKETPSQAYDVVVSLIAALASLIVLYPLMLLVPICVKWVVIGRYKPGEYPLWGTYFFRWWFVTSLEAAVPVGYLAGTPLLNIYFRAMGAKIGRNVHLDSDNFAIYDLVSIGEGSSINVDSQLLGYTVEDGLLKIGHIKIGKNCFVGARSALGLNTTMEDCAALEDLSLLPRDNIIPAGETWLGSPASKLENPKLELEARTSNLEPRTSTVWLGALHAIGLLIFPVLVVCALFPGIIAMNQLNYLDPYYWYLCLAPLVAVSFIVLLCLEIAALKWLLLGRIKPGRYRVRSFFYFRKWFVDQTLDVSLDVIGPLYASVYLTPWYKLLGARLGRGAEVSTASFISPDLLSIGEESFIADSVSLGAGRVRDGWLTIGNNHIGKRSFIGNSALLPPNTTIGDSVLIGCLSVPPANPTDALRYDSAWMGSPPIFLPQRQKSAAFPEETTFNPPTKLRVQRAVIEFIRVITPATCFIALISVLFSAILLLQDYFTLFETLLLFPLLYLGCGLAAVTFTIAAKWLVIRRYRPGERPLWSTFIWRNELINALHEHLAEPFLVGALSGTPFICWYFRLLGARIGRRVYMETSDLSEFDLVTVGDETALNADCTIQTHLFEDRVMKMSTVEIGTGCSVGAGTLVLYDTRMENAARLGNLSLLLKGEVLPAGSRWEGIPASAQPRMDTDEH
jgi:non-ribosomal peptide synthetase-like protein